MHEVAISQGLMELLESEQRQRGFSSIRRVVLRLGAFSHVEPEALRFGFEVASRGTIADGASLDIDIVPADAWCMRCSHGVMLSGRGDPCPDCGSHQLITQGGEEMRLAEMEVL